MVWGKPVCFSPFRAFLSRPAAKPEGPSTVGEVKGKVKIALLILEILLAIAIIASILLQSGRSAGFSGSIMGGGEALFGKKKGLDDTLSKITGILAAVFMVICIIWAILV